MSAIPPDLDLIEILYATGDMSMREVHVQVGTRCNVWEVISRLVRAGVATVWSDLDRRQLADWEVAALVRNRLGQSTEPAPADEHLVLRKGAKLAEAYHRDFGAWYDAMLKR
jgi:hypothetical protein